MTAPFERDFNRYTVVRNKHLTPYQLQQLRSLLASFGPMPPLECVVIESTWPMYTETWQAVQAHVEKRAAAQAALSAAAQALPPGKFRYVPLAPPDE